MVWLMLGGAIVLEVGATLSLKASDGLTQWTWAIPVLIGYVGAFILLAQVLRHGMPIGAAYATWAAAGVVLTAVLGAVLFGESISWAAAAGFVLVAAGVALVELG